MMHKLETAIRTSKRKLVGYKASGSEDAYTDESIRLRRLREEYKSFGGKSGLKEHAELLTVKEFGRKEAAQASGRYKSVASAAEKMYDVGSERENIDAYRRDEPLRRQIREEYPRKIDKGQQRKHFEGTNEYKNYSESFAVKGEYGPSRITISEREIEDLVNEYAGSGVLHSKLQGTAWNGVEVITQNDRIIGVCVNNQSGAEAETSVFKIHWSKKRGYHVVPDYPSKKGAKDKK